MQNNIDLDNFSPILIDVKNVSVHYTLENQEKTCALNAVNFTLKQGEHVAIIGENGSGKSTFLRVLRGEIYPDQVNGGEVFWYDPDKSAKELHEKESLSASFLDDSPLSARILTAIVSPKVQDYYAKQAWNVNCLEIIIAAKTNDYILYKNPEQEEIEEAFNIVKSLGAEHLLYSNINDLSQGQLRIMLIARALIRRAPVLLLDEASNGLDARSQELVFNALQSFVRTKNAIRKPYILENAFEMAESQGNIKIQDSDNYCPSIIMTTHRKSLPNFINKIYSMKKGSLTSLELTQNFFEKNHNKTLASTQTLQVSDLKNAVQENSIKISLKNTDVYLNHKCILHKINLEILPKEQWAIKGENGSGKSTLLSTILGFLPVALGGSICRTYYDKQNPNGLILSELSLIKQHIRLVSDALQTHYTYNDSVEDIIFCGLDGNIGLYRTPTNDERKLVDNCVQSLNLEKLRKRKLHTLSTGQARRTLLARALIGKPSLLLLDEPFSGLDENSCIEIKEILENQIKNGLQTILVSHHESDFLNSTSHTAYMHKGFLSV